MHIQRRSDPPLNLKEWLLVAFIWALFFLQEQIKLIEFTAISEYLSAWWCGVIPGFILIGWFVLLLILGKRIYLRGFYEKAALTILPIILVPLLLSSMMLYHEDIYSLFRSLFFLLGGLFLFPCLVMINPRHKVVYILIHILLIETVLVFLLITLQYHTGYPNFVHHISVRFDTYRVPVQILSHEGMLLLCYVLSYLIYKKFKNFKLLFFFMLIFLLYYMNFLCLTRSATIQIILLLVFATAIILRDKPASFAVKLGYWIVLGCTLLVIVKPVIFSDIKQLGDNIYSSTVYDLKDGGQTISKRRSGFSYYWGEFVNSGLIGFGMVDSTENIYSQKELSCYFSGFNLNDLGIFDTLFRFGFPALIFVIVMFFRMERDLRKSIPWMPRQYRIQAKAIWLLIAAEIILLPASKAFFFPRSNIFYALLMFYVWQVTTIYSNYTEAAYGSH